MHESYAHMRYIWLKKKFGRRRRPALEGARPRHQRPCRCQPRPERAALASWATPTHASSMASTTTDGNLAVYVDAAVGAVAKLKSCAMSLEVIGAGS